MSESRTAGRSAERRAAMRREVCASLGHAQKELPPKYFYDARGAALFDEITRLDEYYLTRAERALLEDFGRCWTARLGARSLVELGAGSADKTRVLLEALPAGGTYVPVDISAAYLDTIAASLSAAYPALRIRPVRSDISRSLRLPRDLPSPAIIAFLGSTLGNFDEPAAIELLRQISAALRPADRLLLGVDLKKDRRVLERAYNDARGVTAEFNRNILRVLNRELGADFDEAAFEHRACYDETHARIEMHLVARDALRVTIPGCGSIDIARGESIRTEISTKYDRATIAALFADAGMEVESWVSDAERRFALVVGCRSR
jgi:L-histidine Nalpha-methyltransferase